MKKGNGKTNVLVVDDLRSMCLTLGRILEGEGHNVVTVEDGYQAIEAVRKTRFDIIFMDTKMPGIDGVETFREIKRINPEAAVIIMTGYASMETAVDAVNQGAYAYFVKPVSPDELKTTIANALKQQRLSLENKRLVESLQQSNKLLLEANKELRNEITERKQLEEERQKAARLESVGTLAGGIAHDFNNLLTAITGYIGLAKRSVQMGEAEKASSRLVEAEHASMRARDLTQQLLTFARSGAPVRTVASIAQLIRDSATFALRGSNVRCDFFLPDDLWPVEVDEGQMNQVISNFVINADEAMPEGGVLTISTREAVIGARSRLPLDKGKYIEIIVEDQGTGIRKEHLDRIFDPYFTTKQKGSGLGLATTYSIVKNHDGYIIAQSKLGVGTTFHIYLPASEKPVPTRKEVVAEAPITGRGRILVMDDEDIIRELLHDELTDIGYEVELTVDGAQAIEQYANAKESGKPFDAVILDLTVPGGMGGKDVIKKMLEIDPSVKAIVSSGYSTDPIMSDFVEYGFSGVVAKPYKIEQLEKALHSILVGTSE